MGERASREALPEIVGLGEGNQMRAGRKERNVIDSSEEEEKVLGKGLRVNPAWGRVTSSAGNKVLSSVIIFSAF